MDKTGIVPTKPKDKIFFGLLHLHSKFQSRQILSASDMFIRPASIVAEGFHFQFPISEPPNLAAKENFCLSTRLPWLIWQMIAKLLTVLFIKSILPNFYPGQILLAVRLKICPLRPIRLKKCGETRSCLGLHFFRALSSSCVLYSRTECSQAPSIPFRDW